MPLCGNYHFCDKYILIICNKIKKYFYLFKRDSKRERGMGALGLPATVYKIQTHEPLCLPLHGTRLCKQVSLTAEPSPPPPSNIFEH